MRYLSLLLASIFALFAGNRLAHAALSTISVDADKPGAVISPTLFGIFFEDINCSADGGLYAELVRNRNFQDAERPVHWTALGKGLEMAVETAQPVSPNNPRYLRVQFTGTEAASAGIMNEGFWGINVVEGDRYDLSLFARAAADFEGLLTASLEGSNGVVYAKAALPKLTAAWKPYRFTLKSKASDPQARLVIRSSRAGRFFLDMVSLMPQKTWKKRSNGLRPDLAEMLAGLKPTFVRFPGGCWVEGENMSLAYRWKQTIGDTSERRTQHNIWQYEATHGIGYHEYLQMCEDLKSEPLFVINCGMSHSEVVPMDKMQEYVQDALDAIEYANGPASSTWGAVRAKNGHPAPFNLKFMEIGNENGGAAYHERYALFHDAIKSKYPQIRLVANEWSGIPGNRPLDIVDEHYYSTPEFFIRNATKYDSYDRAGHKVYVGEYACTQNCGQGNLRAAVGEAAFMTGMERNADVVVMASYAPLFANVHYKKWNPDLINFDSSRVYGLPSYYVQKMFSENLGDRVLPVSIQAPEIKPPDKAGMVGVGTWRTVAEFKDMKVTRKGQDLLVADFSKGMQGWKAVGGQWSVTDGVLRQGGMDDGARVLAGDRSWDNYTYTLKARKVSGAEGFLIPFAVQNEESRVWWNIGGWGNTRHALQMDGFTTPEVSGSIETGRWYDIRIEIQGSRIQCFLDGKLIHDAVYPRTESLYASASRAKNKVYLKVANVSFEPQTVTVNLNGVTVASEPIATVLTSADPADENTLDQPLKVAPRTEKVPVSGSGFQHTFPANSVTVFNLKVR